MAAIVLTLTLTGPAAYAHTTSELDAWVADWSARVWLTGEVNYTLLWQYRDIANRHPCYFREECPPPRPQPHNHTPTPQVQAYSAGVEQWRTLVASYFRAGDVDKALRIMACESGGVATAANRSSARGLFQHLGKYWVDRSAAAGFAGVSIFDPTANVATAAWLRDQPGGWGHWACR